MNQSRTPSYFLNRNLFVILFSVVLEPVIFMSLLPRFMAQNLGFSSWALQTVLSVVFYSGVYAVNIELIAGREPCLSISRIIHGCKKFWRVYSLFFFIPLFIDFLADIFTSSGLNVRIIHGVLDGPLLVLFLLIVCKKENFDFSIKNLFQRIGWGKDWFFLVICYSAMLIGEIIYVGLPARSNFLAVSVVVGRLAHFAFLAVVLSLISRACLKQEDQKNKPEIYFIEPSGAGILQALSLNLTSMRSGVSSILKAVTPDRYCIKEFSRILWRDDMFCGNKLVVITSFTSNCADAYWIAKKFREKGSKVIVGGSHMMFLPDEALMFCDSVVIGDLENVWSDVIQDFENDNLQKIYSAVGGSAPEDIHQRILKLPPEDIVRILQTGKGCKFHCDFCAVSAMTDGKMMYKDIGETIELFKKATKAGDSVAFLDSNIFMDPARAREFFRQLEPLKIKWQASCSIDIAKNEEDLKLAKRSGCRGLLIGYEVTGDSFEAKKGGKYSYSNRYVELTRRIHKHGIGVKAHFICGFDNEGLMCLIKLWWLAFRLMSRISVVLILTPFPGTKFFDNMFKSERVINLNWEKFSGVNMVFSHENYHHRFFTAVFPVFYTGFILTTSRIGLLILFFEFTSLLF